MIGDVLVMIGALLAALSALGAVRFRSTLPRMHSLTKAATGGIVFALLGAAFALRTSSAVTTIALALALQLFTFPVGANLVAHGVYTRGHDGFSRADHAD
jgi:multicomponent Na+:H+ antiporter subunit G